MLKTKKINSLPIIVMVLLFTGYIFPVNSHGQEALEIMEFSILTTTLTKNGIQINFNLHTNNDTDTESWLVTSDVVDPAAASGWSSTKPDQITLNIQSGSIILYAWVKNGFEEISRPVSAHTIIYPMPVQNSEEFKSAGTSYFRFKDTYGKINFPTADLLVVAGGGGGGGGASGASETEWDGSNTCYDGSSGGGGGAGQLLNNPVYSLDPFITYLIYIGKGGEYGRGGGKHYSGHSGSGGNPSYFLEAGSSDYILYAHPGGGGERGKNKGGAGDGGSGYPSGHRRGGPGGDNGRGHGGSNGGSAPDNSGGGGGGGKGSDCHSSGHKGGYGGSGYMRIKWMGILNE